MYDTAIRSADLPELFGVASEQASYFTAAQAHACGYSKQLLSHHAGSGRFIRLRRGLYRLRDYPSSRYEDVMAAWLAAGRDSAVVSHESALDLLDLSDVVPDRVHLTVPRSRRGLVLDPLISLHTTVHPVQPEDTVIREGIRLTEPLRTILDAAEMGTGPEQLVMAIKQADRRGWLVGSNLRARAEERGTRVADLVEVALDGG